MRAVYGASCKVQIPLSMNYVLLVVSIYCTLACKRGLYGGFAFPSSRGTSRRLLRRHQVRLLQTTLSFYFLILYFSGLELIGRSVPESVTLLDGRVAGNLPQLVGESVFSSVRVLFGSFVPFLILQDVAVASYLLYAAEVVTVPASGFLLDSKKGTLRISLAVSVRR